MTHEEIMQRLSEIQSEFCPADEEQIRSEIDAGYYDLCGCAICQLLQDLTVAEVLNYKPYNIDFEAPPNATDAELEKLIEQQAEREYGSADKIEITEMDYR